MKIVRKSDIEKPVVNETGERIYEMLGRPKELGGSRAHSLGHVVIPRGSSSRLHYHPTAEETYYILSGQGRLVVDGAENTLRQGDAVLIMPKEQHQIFSVGYNDLEFLVVCAPAWDSNNSVYLNPHD